MPSHKFYFDAKDEKQQNVYIELSDEQQKQRQEDWEVIRGMRDYQKRYHDEWKQAARAYNVIQDGSSDERMSNIYIGLARMIIDTGISMMTEGEPDFDFAPLGPSDYKKVILWKSALKMVLSQCNFRSHQERFITDFHVFGTGAFEVYTQMPYRKKRYEDENGSIIEKVVRDFRRSKVGVRHVSPFHCWRSPNVADPDDVPVAGKFEILTYNQFVQNYGNVYLPDGQPKYDQKVIKQLLGMGSSHFQVLPHYDEIQDVYRIYALPFGTTPEAEAINPPENEIGAPIFDKPLTIKRVKGKDGMRSSGANVLGLTPLCFGINNDQYDRSFKTHAVYGMGIPRLIEGPEMAFEAMFNMTLDNLRLQNTVTLSYNPKDGKTGLDLDNLSFYSGMFVDGEVIATPWGQARVSDNSLFWEWLNNLCVWLTGINFQQLVGDTSKTAFEFAQRIRANNQRAEKRIRGLENGCLKRMATLLLSNVLSELTVEEWEDLTEEQAQAIADRLSSGEAAGEDYKDYVDGKPTKRRVHMYIPIEGKKLREDFSTTKKRKLDYNSTENTLIEDPNMEGEVSYVPAVEQYLYPLEYIESGMLPDVLVDGKRMLGDLKAQDTANMKMVSDHFRTRLAESAVPGMEDQRPNVDMKKIDAEMLKFAGIEEKKVQKEDSDGSGLLKYARETLKDLESLSEQPPHVPITPTGAVPAAPPQSQGPQPESGAVPQPENALQATAAGTL